MHKSFIVRAYSNNTQRATNTNVNLERERCLMSRVWMDRERELRYRIYPAATAARRIRMRARALEEDENERHRRIRDILKEKMTYWMPCRLCAQKGARAAKESYNVLNTATKCRACASISVSRVVSDAIVVARAALMHTHIAMVAFATESEPVSSLPARYNATTTTSSPTKQHCFQRACASPPIWDILF